MFMKFLRQREETFKYVTEMKQPPTEGSSLSTKELYKKIGSG